MAAEIKVRGRRDLERMVPLFLAMVAGVALAFNLLVCWKVYRNAPLREAAMRLVDAGETTLQEINRVTFVA